MAKPAATAEKGPTVRSALPDQTNLDPQIHASLSVLHQSRCHESLGATRQNHVRLNLPGQSHHRQNLTRQSVASASVPPVAGLYSGKIRNEPAATQLKRYCKFINYLPSICTGHGAAGNYSREHVYSLFRMEPPEDRVSARTWRNFAAEHSCYKWVWHCDSRLPPASKLTRIGGC